MVRHKLLVLGLLALSLALIWGCSDRLTEPTKLTYDAASFTAFNHQFYDELKIQINNEFQLQPMMFYIPEVAWDLNHPLPLLVLLAPEGEDAYFYVHHGLLGLYEEMKAEGEIGDMVIVTMSPEGIAPVFGGYLYAGEGLPGGKYDDIMGQKLWDFLANDRLAGTIILNQQSKRGIGGIGVGAYGAFRAALLNPGFWGSISAVDGPLDFDGADGNSGLIPLMDSVFAEQPGLTQADFCTAFDTSRSNQISRFFCGASMAFTPHDQNIESLLIEEVVQWVGTLPQMRITLNDSLRGTAPYILMDSTTLVQNVVKEDARNLDFHLPFSYDQRPYQPIWETWLDNNLESYYTGVQFPGTDIWFGTSEDAKWGYHDMTMSWANTLGPNLVDEIYEYSGSIDRPATGNQYVYDLLRKMLKFHSDSFYK